MPRSGPAPSPASSDPPASGSSAAERLDAEVRELRTLAARLLDRQEDARRLLARALHDGAGGSLTAIRMAAHAALAEDDPAQRRADLDDILAQAGEALDRIRALCAGLRPPPLDAVGVEAALRWHVEQLGIADRDRVTLQVSALPRRPEPAVEQACFRVAEEALANALRHSGAGDIVLALEATGDGLRLEVHDNGSGFDPDAATTGTGLAIMRERVRGLGGQLRISSSRSGGTLVLADFPVR